MERAVPMLAMGSSAGVIPPSSSNALEVGLCDAQQLEVMSSGSNDSPAAAAGDTMPAAAAGDTMLTAAAGDTMPAAAAAAGDTLPAAAAGDTMPAAAAAAGNTMPAAAVGDPAAVAGDTRPAAMNPLLLASACFGSWTALNYLFSKENKQAPPMIQPNQVFLDLLVGYPAGNSTNGRLTVLQVSEDVEDVVDQPASPTTALLLKGVTAEGNTALHAVASNGDSKKFLNCATIIYKRDQTLLFVANKKGDTPVHFAARAGKSQMISCLIELAKSCNRLHELLRKENVLKETALHDAVRTGNVGIVESLLMADPELANYPKEGTSPLYLSIIMGKNFTAWTLHDISNGYLSYSGPNGRNALHAAISRDSGITELVLKWNNSLTTLGDRDGSTPLHLASSFRNLITLKELLKANPSQVYQADNSGMFPIHVAASMGRKHIISILLEKFPNSAGLCTAQGRTFLHVAVVKRRLNIVSFVCQTPSLAWILNMQDNDGNTALHLAVIVSRLRIFCSLYGNTGVRLNLANNNDETPTDLSRKYIPPGMYYNWDNEIQIYRALKFFGDNHSGLRLDQYEEKYSRLLKPEDKVKEAQKMKDSSQILGIGSVLIATVAFGATFAIPGGFIADDRTHRGTPILAGRYTFDAFMMANALAFICSSTATIGIMLSGSPLLNLKSRRFNFFKSSFFMESSVTCLTTAFALGVYMVLAPVAQYTAIAICALSPIVVLYRNIEFFVKLGILAQSLFFRTGLTRPLKWLAPMVVRRLLLELWPFILIFGWAAIARKIRIHHDN